MPLVSAGLNVRKNGACGKRTSTVLMQPLLKFSLGKTSGRPAASAAILLPAQVWR